MLSSGGLSECEIAYVQLFLEYCRDADPGWAIANMPAWEDYAVDYAREEAQS